MVCRNSLLLVVAGPLASAGSEPWQLAGDVGEYTFTVLKDGSPVGRHCIVFQRPGGARRDPRGDRDRGAPGDDPDLPVRARGNGGVAGRSRAAHRRHDQRQRREAQHRRTTRRQRLHFRRINGRVDEFDDSKQVLAFWNKDVVNHDDFFSAVEDKIIKASFEFVDRTKSASPARSSTSTTIAWRAMSSATSGSTDRDASRRSRSRVSAQKSRTCATRSIPSSGIELRRHPVDEPESRPQPIAGDPPGPDARGQRSGDHFLESAIWLASWLATSAASCSCTASTFSGVSARS